MNYVTDVAALILARCPNVTSLSPMDFTIIAEWEKQEIPLEVILKSINEVCDEFENEGSGIESIGYFQSRAKSNFMHWLQSKFVR